MSSGHVTIWQVDFTFARPPEAVKSLPSPDEITNSATLKEFLLLPTHSRLAVAFPGKILVWDTRDSKFLLKTSSSYASNISFSPDGLLFVCLPGPSGDVWVWKETLSATPFINSSRLPPFPRPRDHFLPRWNIGHHLPQFRNSPMTHKRFDTLPESPTSAPGIHSGVFPRRKIGGIHR